MLEENIYCGEVSSLEVGNDTNMEKLTESNYMALIRDDLSRYLKINGISPEAFGDNVRLSGRAIRDILDGKAKDVGMGNAIRIRQAIHLPIYTSRPGQK